MPNPVVHEFGGGQWSQLRDLLDDYCHSNDYGTWAFRGESSIFWEPAQSPLDRLFARDGQGPHPAADTLRRLAAEKISLIEFRRDSSEFLEPSLSSKLNEWACVSVVGRHHGLPTRLVDWSRSPWIAAYFACSGNLSKHGRILVFNHRQLSCFADLHFLRHTDCWRLPSPEEPGLLQPKLVEQIPPFVLPLHHHEPRFRRVVAQQGMFTFASKPDLSHWKWLTANQHLTGVTELHIAPTLKLEVIRRLEVMGITGQSLFPEIGGVVQRITNHIVNAYCDPAG